MKKWMTICLLAVVIVLAVFFVMGYMAKNNLKRLVDAFPNTTAAKLTLTDYHQHFFSSDAILSVMLHVPAQNTTDSTGELVQQAPADYLLNIPLLIKHGPFISRQHGLTFGMGQVTTIPETHYGLYMNYLNQSVLSYTLPSLSITGDIDNKRQFHVDWKGMSAFINISSNVDAFEGLLTVDGLNGTANNIDFKIGEIRNDFQFKRFQEALWVGPTHYTLSSITIEQEDKKLFDLEGLEMLLGTDIKDTLLNYHLNLSLQKLFVNNLVYGTGSVKLNLNNLDADAMAKFNQQQLETLQNNNNPSVNVLALLSNLPKLLNKGPVLELSEMDLNLPEGRVIGHFKLSIPPGKANDPSKIMSELQGEGYFRAPIIVVKDLLLSMQTQKQTSPAPAAISSTPSTAPDPKLEAEKQLNSILENMTNKGFLKSESGDYIVEFKINAQKLYLNGKLFEPNNL